MEVILFGKKMHLSFYCRVVFSGKLYIYIVLNDDIKITKMTSYSKLYIYIGKFKQLKPQKKYVHFFDE